MDFLAILLVLPLGLYLFHGGGRGHVWGLVPAGEATRGEGAYRRTEVRLWKAGSAPIVVRVAALSSFFIGQMILPGGIAALVGLAVTVEMLSRAQVEPLLLWLELVAPTGLAVLAMLLSAGTAMLSRADDASARARSAARWETWQSTILLGGLGAAAMADIDCAYPAVIPAACAGLGIGHATLLRRAAAALDAFTAQQDNDPAPPEAELEVFGARR